MYLKHGTDLLKFRDCNLFNLDFRLLDHGHIQIKQRLHTKWLQILLDLRNWNQHAVPLGS